MLRSTLHALVTGVLRRTWLVAVVTLIACASFAARAVAAIVEADALAPAPAGSAFLAPPRPAATTTGPRSRPDAETFVARNIFCSTCSPVHGPGPTDPAVTYTGHAAVLISTTIGADPIATVRVPETEVQGTWSLGERIPGVGTIDRIGWVSIDVHDDAGHAHTLSLDLPAVGPGDGAATPVPEAPADPFADRIRKVDDHTYEVDRALVRELVSGAARPGQMRMLPIVKDGDVKGVRVYGVQPGSVAAAIGLRSGDQITAINDDPIKAAQQLLDLYAKLDQLSSVELAGTRGGKPLTVALRLR